MPKPAPHRPERADPKDSMADRLHAPWPAGAGEMARRIREHDWAGTPLGPIHGWSERFRLAVEMMLDHPTVSSLACGPERILVYNDAAAALYGAHHPAALGRPLPDTFPDGWATVAAHYRRAFAGETVTVSAQPLDTRGEGAPGDVFDALLVPVRDAEGRVACVRMTGTEIGGRLRAEAALRESERRLQAAFDAMDEGYLLADVVLDGAGRAVDIFYLDSNPAARRIIGTDPKGRSLRDISSGYESYWYEIWGRVATTGAGERLQRYSAPDGLWYDFFVFKLHPADPASRRVAVIFRDVSEPRRTQERLKASEERQAFLLGLSDALRPLSDPVAIQEAACRRLAERLDVDRAYYVEVDEAAGVARVARDVVRDGVPSIAGTYRVGDFGWSLAILRRGACHVVSDTQTSDLVPEADRPASAALGIVACVGAPLFKGGRLVGALCVTDTRRRAWTEDDVELVKTVGERIWASVERARAESALRDSEERLRQFGEATQDVLWIRHAGTLQWTYLTPAFEAVYGLGIAEALKGDHYRNWQDLVIAEDRAEAVSRIDRVREGEAICFEYRIRRPDGSLRWLRDTDFPMRDEAGRVRRIGGISQDVTSLKESEERLRTSEGRLRALVEGVSQLVWRAVGHGDWTWASPQWTAFTGQAEAESHGLGWLATVHPDDRAHAMAAWERVKDTEGLQAEFRIRNAATGAYRWFQTRAAPRRDARGRVVEWLGTSTDVHQLKVLQNSQAVMVAELQHRTRNLIAVVRGIADDTMEHTGPAQAFRAAFSARLTALSRVQGLLSRAEVEPVTLAAVLRLEFDAFGAGTADPRITVAGPDVWLHNANVQTLALALHELATNARKYGALSHEGGRLAVTWSERAEGGERRLLLDWTETGLEQAPARTRSAPGGGYGRELIERALPYALGAGTSYAIDGTGVRCTIDLPARPDPQGERAA